MPVSDRIRRLDSISPKSQFQKSASGVSSEESSFLLGIARHYRDRLLAEENLEEMTVLPPNLRRDRLEKQVSRMMQQEGISLTPSERSGVITFILNEAVGRGPLEPLMTDPTITEIMVNSPHRVYIERQGKITYRPDIQFKDTDHIRHIVDRIISPLGRRVDESSPMVDARTEDGSRVHVAVSPVSLNGPVLTIRRFRKDPFKPEMLVDNNTSTREMMDFLRACVVGKQNILVSGGTGSGKTTTLNVLASFIPENERIITIEDAAELQFHKVHNHVLRMESRPPNVEGEGEITMRQLVRNALRMRPDRIIVGEVRGAEALDMLQAMNTGHEGSMTTLHANTAPDALARLETMVLWAEGMREMPLTALREHLVSALNIIVQQDRFPDGGRRITAISEIQGVRKGQYVLKNIFVYDRFGVDTKSRVQGKFSPTGVVPKCLSNIRAAGVQLSPGMFQPEHLVAEIGSDILDSDDVFEIMINGPKDIYVERRKEDGTVGIEHLQGGGTGFRDEAHLLGVINRIVAPLGRRVDEMTPYVDARLPDGKRVNVVLPPIAINGPTITIRRFPEVPLQASNLLLMRSCTRKMLLFLQAAVRARLNILVSGGTGSGKTTLLNILSSFIPSQNRIITIEDVAELKLAKPHWVRLETRPPDEYSEGEVTTRDLVRNALRMRPDRIIVGEVRGPEALDMLQAMNTGHEGSLTTIHANSPEDAFSRLETMVMWAKTDLGSEAVRQQMVSALTIVVQQGRMEDGRRKITEISEVPGDYKEGQIKPKPIFVFEREGIQPSTEGNLGQVIGKFRATGFVPQCAEKFKKYGIEMPDNIFQAETLDKPSDFLADAFL